MQSAIDYEGSKRSFGYTVDDDGEIWYWSVPESGDTVEFRGYGYHTNHPFNRTGKIPEDVKNHAQTHVDASIEENDLPQY